MDTTMPHGPRRAILFASGSPRIAVDLQVEFLSDLLKAGQTLAAAGWALTPKGHRAISRVAGRVWPQFTAKQQSRALNELRSVWARLERIADGGSAVFEIRDVEVSTRVSADGIQQASSYGMLGTEFEKRTMFILYEVIPRRCHRCRRLFAIPRKRRGTPQRYCSRTCAGTTATQRWRENNREKFRAQRKVAYRRRLERLGGDKIRRIRIQNRRQTLTAGGKERDRWR
jgi:hypothetical protein